MKILFYVKISLTHAQIKKVVKRLSKCKMK